MQYSTILLSALSITSAFAAPATLRRQATADTSIRVGLSNQRIELGTGTTFDETALPDTKSGTGSSGPFDTVDLRLGADVVNKALRCQLISAATGLPILLIRNGVQDTTFADGGASAPWAFVDGEQDVSSITCDPAFVKVSAPAIPPAGADTSIRVQLNDEFDLATQTAFELGGLQREEQRTVGSFGPYVQVTLTIGADVDPALRCQILDNDGEAITLLRNGNVDTTFAQGEPWSFLDPERSEVPSIVCDPAFVKAVQA
ncbi:unnamed protein product [Zymoseptoria tritici ST99CH_1E4]|uniref:Ubiquitin 3 binding protein But2 C-terminal domain-containing protein n=1 Tax=Zymoseptoria tritici ST99CH_1E4 TaxID=1276532 RepID=A0A2H1H7S6_ZYMTR|nr:unnamed protein product [Zymoseptoria tritici ST99CH_1E4]